MPDIFDTLNAPKPDIFDQLPTGPAAAQLPAQAPGTPPAPVRQSGYVGRGEFAADAGASSVPLAVPGESDQPDRARAFLQGAGVPTSIPEAQGALQFLVRSPVQDVKDIYSGLTEIPEKVRNWRETLATSPAATVVHDPLSPEAFGVYGTAAGMLVPGIMEKFRGEPATVSELPPESKTEAQSPTPPGPESKSQVPAQPNDVPVSSQAQIKEALGKVNGSLPEPLVQPEADLQSAPPKKSELIPRAFTEPTLARYQPPETTADVTRAILDRRKILQEEADQLGQQVDIARSMGMRPHPAVEERLAEINDEIANPTIAEDASRTTPESTDPQEPANRVSQQTPPPLPSRESQPPVQEQPASAPSVRKVSPEQQAASPQPQDVPVSSLPQGPTEPGVSLPKPPNEEVLPNGETLTPREPATPVEQATPISRIANRFTEERSAAGEIGEIAPGEGYSAQDLLNRGLRMSPEEVTQHVSDVVNNAGGDPKLQAAAIRAEEARLSQRSVDLSRAADANPSDVQAKAAADGAFQDLTDFHNGPVAKLKNNWHAQGMALQGELPVDLSTFNGQREAWLRDTGKPPPVDVEPLLRKSARRVSDVEAQERGAMNRLGEEIDRASSNRRFPAPEELRNRIIERMKDVPCRI